jgi:hypothetical protein
MQPAADDSLEGGSTTAGHLLAYSNIQRLDVASIDQHMILPSTYALAEGCSAVVQQVTEGCSAVVQQRCSGAFRAATDDL